jgi:hypothetical protein
MESKLVLFDIIKELPPDGYCKVTGEDSAFLQRILFRKGYIFAGAHPHVTRDDRQILWWRFYENEGQSIPKKLTVCMEVNQVSHLCDLVEFSDYFKPKPKYEGYVTGRQFGI